MGLVLKPEFMRINIITRAFFMLRLLDTKSGVGLVETGFLDCPTRMGGLT